MVLVLFQVLSRYFAIGLDLLFDLDIVVDLLGIICSSWLLLLFSSLLASAGGFVCWLSFLLLGSSLFKVHRVELNEGV